MKNLEKTKTEQNLNDLIIEIRNQFKGKPFMASFIKIDKTVNISIGFSYLYRLGFLEKIRRGVYKETDYLKNVHDLAKNYYVEIKKMQLKSVNERRRRKPNELYNTYNYNFNKQLNEAECVDFLKSKGYKIMKLINKYEEI